MENASAERLGRGAIALNSVAGSGSQEASRLEPATGEAILAIGGFTSATGWFRPCMV